MSVITDTPKRFRKASLNNGKPTEVTKHLKDFVSKKNIESGKIGGCLTLSGSVGVGKSEGLYGLLNGKKILSRLLQDDELEIGVITPSFFSEYQCAPFEEKQNILEEAQCVDILCIDDLGMEEPNYRNVELLEMILDYRYSEMMTTIITTNLPAEAFKARYPERIIDRLREWGTFVEISGTSLREDPDQEFPASEETDWDRAAKEMEKQRQMTLKSIEAMDDKTREKLFRATEKYLMDERQREGLLYYYGRISDSEVTKNMPMVAEKLCFFQDDKTSDTSEK